MAAILRTRDLAIGYGPARGPRPADGQTTESSAPAGAAARCLLFGHLDLELSAGKLVALLGPNGVGKSTLLRTLAGLQPPQEGTVELDGHDLRRVRPPARAKRVAVALTARPAAPLMTVHELVALGRYPHTGWLGRLGAEDEAKIRAALDQVDAAGLADRPIAELSDGEYQRVALARALAQEADVLLLDEILAFLDLPRRVEMLHLLRRLAHEGRAILLASHDLDLVMRAADVLWLLDPQGLLHRGTPEELALSGALAGVFAAEGVSFDAEAGIFRFPSRPRGEVALAGDGRAAFWTGRALDRLGYRVAEDAATRVTVGDAGQGWRLERAGASRRFENLESLLDALGDA